MDNIKERTLEMHRAHRGKLEVVPKVEICDTDSLSLAYTPGVAEPCREIAKNPDDVYTYTTKGNMVAIVTDGTAVLGLGDIGPAAALPVMEGKACLFKTFGGVDAFPICLDTKDPDEIVRAVQLIAPGFGGINLEDISAPRCFEIEQRLIELLDIPVFHDDQHGTAVVVLASLINAAKCIGKPLSAIKTVISGAGAAGISICRLLLKAGVEDIILCDRSGAIYEGREGLNSAKEAIAAVTNRSMCKGTLADAMVGCDLFIGVSGPGIVTPDMVRSMADKPIIFAYHGYPTLIHELTYRRHNRNLHVRGYKEEGTITTPFDMRVLNDIDRFDLVIDTVQRLPQLGNRGAYLIQKMNDKLVEHRQYSKDNGVDLPEVRAWKWNDGKCVEV